ncbi:MAG: hypothetical protein K5785_08845 [Nitrosarchaeum sp.]|nr:hypothetical protein [Nitrosarchaeum sp.]
MKTRNLITMLSIFAVFAISVTMFGYDQYFQSTNGNKTHLSSLLDGNSLCFDSKESVKSCYLLDELRIHGCSTPILEHLAQYSNLLDAEYHEMFYIEWPSLPNNISEKDYDACIEFLNNVRLPLIQEDKIDTKSEPESPATPTAFADGIVEIVNPEHEPLKYKTTIPVIDETYLSKNIQQWSDTDRHELDSGYQKYGDDFYTELGRLLIKNEMQYQMNNLGIVNANDDFEVFSGGMLTSLPPHIGFSAVVYATDGNYYRLQGGTFANQVSYYRTTQLQFPDTAENLPMESLLDKPQLVTILPEDGNKARQEPSTLVIHADDGTVEFFNNTPDVIRIQDSGSGRIGEEDTLAWIGPTVLPFQSATMTFDISGLIEWDARKAPNLENPLWWQTHAGGDIIVLSDDIDGFSRDDRARIAQKMLHNSDIPIVSSGAGNAEKVLKINLDPAIVAMVPDAEEYYLKRAHQLIPFDVEIVIDGR